MFYQELWKRFGKNCFYGALYVKQTNKQKNIIFLILQLQDSTRLFTVC